MVDHGGSLDSLAFMSLSKRGGANPIETLTSMHPAVAILALLAVATLLGLIESSQVQYDRAVQGNPINWEHALIHGLPRWYSWALLAPLVILGTRRIAKMRLGWIGTLAAHLPLAAVVILAQIAVFSVASTVLHGGPEPLGHLEPAFLKYIGLTFLGGLVTYGTLVGGWYGLDLYGRFQEREKTATKLELQTAELKALLAESQLERLQAQLEPHFLFNTLHALSSLMLEGETTKAVRMTSRLSELLRRALSASESAEHTLAQEIDLVEDYIAIQRLRFEERLSVEVEIGDGLHVALVPALLLQPIVENAVVHGIEQDPAAGRLFVTASRQGRRVRIRVANEGPALAEGQQESVGLRNTRERLRGLYGTEASLELKNTPEGLVETVITLPYRVQADLSADVST